VCNARGDTSTLAQIATNLETLRDALGSENLPADIFPGGETDGGKGDKRRETEDPNNFVDNWDRIFGKKEDDGIDTSDVEPFHIRNARQLKMQDLEFKEKLAEEKRRKEQELFDRLDKEVEEESKDEN
jgi:hypothetical protein